MNHKQKVKLARSMLTPQERFEGTGIFISKAWTERAEAIQLRVNKKQHEKKNTEKTA